MTPLPTGMVFDIQRFCTHDGPGLRTTVFLKGCPLHCDWCHNPESIGSAPDILFSPARCGLCGACAATCRNGAHTVSAAGHRYDRTLCRHCLRCVEACPSGALTGSGKEMSVETVLRLVARDIPFYASGSGGLTVSGGEPFFQPDFLAALLAGARAQGIHTCVETSGMADPADVERIAPLTDLFLWDIKDLDADRLKRHTGADLARVLDNLARVDRLGRPTRLRAILIRGVNDGPDHIEKLAALFRTLGHGQGIDLIPLHDLGEAKAEQLGSVRPDCGLRGPDEQSLRKARTLLDKLIA